MYNLENIRNQVIQCRTCSRLVNWRETVAAVRRREFKDQEYWGKPVPGFGDPDARVFVVGLAPGAHGSNRTGRMFTGDASGVFLYRALFEAGFANLPTSTRADDLLELKDLYISAICRCVPPDNKPTSEEILSCLPFLVQEFLSFQQIKVVVALGKIAFDGVLKSIFPSGLTNQKPVFGHGKIFTPGLNHPYLVSSYHPSRQNTQTGRLTKEMFSEIWSLVKSCLTDNEVS